MVSASSLVALGAALAVAVATATAKHPKQPLPACDPSNWTLPVRGKYATAGSISEDKLNVHLIAHTHLDP